MSFIVSCPTDPNRVALSPDGRSVVTDDGGAPCVCDTDACPRVLRFSRCSVIQCPPPGEIPAEVFICATTLVMIPDGPVTRDTAGNIIDGGGTVTVQWSNGSVLVCYAYEGEAPRGTPLTRGTATKFGRLCGTPECDQDLCGRYWRVRPCGRDIGVAFYVRAPAAGTDYAGGTFRAEYPPGSGNFVCLCLRPNGTPIRQDALPPGAVLLPTPELFYRDCCQCGASLGRCTSATYQEWIGYNVDGGPRYRDVDCCCNDGPITVEASGSIRVRGVTIDDPADSSEVVILIDGAVQCPGDSSNWYLTGVIISYVREQEVQRDIIGCPGGNRTVYPVDTFCGAYLRRGEDDFRAPSPPPASFQGSRSITGGCQSRQESWSVENIQGQADGSRTRSTSIGTFSVAVKYSPDDGCTDDCSRRRTGGPNQQPVDPGIAAGLAEFLALQERMFGCKGCGQ